MRELLVNGNGYKKSYVNMDLNGANLSGVILNEANLKQANLTDAKLRGSDLRNANLTEVQAIGTDFSEACLTGACLESWNIDHSTKLDQVDCQYVFLLEQPNALGSRERRPHNSSTVFSPGDFEKLYKTVVFFSKGCRKGDVILTTCLF